ncbi:hypothetical protein A3860_20015 [Niastella vici]|uniref:DoxX family protein n=1 Tax=Niastella vici TaxID=1703345 RepID=A0A1V9G117_9BACT|nr:DoxX family protein [Niastella vici]OQP64264.1 hypothetical protein A3860_20015 [Niastella vici]
MNTTLITVQCLLALTLLYSGICKSIKSEQWLVTHGQTGVAGLPLWFTRFIGISEIAGAAGIILPTWLNILPALTSITAILFCVLMLFAMRIHNRLKEPKSVMINITLFILSAFVAWGRWPAI